MLRANTSLTKFLMIITTVFAVGLGCGKKDDDDDSSSDSSGTNSTVTGSLNLSGSSALALAATYTIKATYAKFDEDSGTLDSGGAYSLTVKDAPFSLTVFSGDAPVCNFIFQVGSSSVGSFETAGDLDLGSINCEDGQAVVPSDRIADKAKGSFKDAVESGAISDELVAKITDPLGLSVKMLRGGPGGEHGEDLTCPDCGPRPDDFKPIEPKLCKSGGYEVSEFAFRDFRRNYDDEYDREKDEAGGGSGTTIFVEKQENGTYNMVVRSEEESAGGEVDEVFTDIKLGGFDKEFALIGKTVLDEKQLKAEVAEHSLRELLRNLDTGIQPPPPPTWTDSWCDPVNIVNEILIQLGHTAYTTQTVFSGDMGFHGSHGGPGGSPKPLCSTLNASSDAALLLEDFCYDIGTDGVTKTLQTHADLAGDVKTAALSICQAAEEGAPVNYWSFRMKDADGNPIKDCAKETNDQFGSNWQREWLGKTEGECQALQQESWNNPPNDGSNLWYNWMEVERSMNTDCSVLRAAGHSLQVCYWTWEPNLEPNYEQPDWDTQPQPDRWWDGKYTLAEGDNAITEAQTTAGGGHSPMQQARERIDQCMSNFDRTSQELAIRTANIEAVKKAALLISTTKDADGNLKYIKETESKYKRQGDFSFTSAKMDKLNAVLTKATAAVHGWQASINAIKDTYATLKKAALKADAADASKCLPDALGTQAKFEVIYSKFDKAFNGDSTNTNPGIEKWQNKAFNHFQCMQWDENIRRIKEFGITAPVQGQKDSNKSAEETASSSFLTLGQGGGNCNGFYDHRGRCVETVNCAVPPGAATYIPFDTLLDLATIEDECKTVTEKVAMMGRELATDQQFGPHTAPSGSLFARVLLHTKMPKKDCKMTLKFPKMDKDSCFAYENSAGKTWGSLTSDERKTATASEFTLKYRDQEVKMANFSNKESFEILLIPNGSVESQIEEGDTESDEFNEVFGD